MTTFITFGVDHDFIHPHVGSHLSSGYLAINAGDPAQERGLAHALLGPRFAFSYDKRPDHPGYTQGEIGRLAYLDKGDLAEIAELIKTAEDAVEGDSSDEEITALQDVVTWVSQMLELKR